MSAYEITMFASLGFLALIFTMTAVEIYRDRKRAKVAA